MNNEEIKNLAAALRSLADAVEACAGSTPAAADPVPSAEAAAAAIRDLQELPKTKRKRAAKKKEAPAAEAKGVTLRALRERAQAHLTSGRGIEHVRTVLQDAGFPSVTALPESKYQEVYDALGEPNS